ncbi:MAG TPA: hypothetical protein VGG28_30510 [Kofleriaceae bacterium]
MITVDDAVERLKTDSYWTRRHSAQITPAFVRELLARESRAARHMMLRLAVPLDVDDAALMQRWRRAAEALRGLDLTYAWGSKQRRARFRELAADREMLAAIQGAAGLGDDVPLDMLAVLVADGSDASIDALIPHLGPALDTADDRLEWLRRLRTHATGTPRVTALLDELEARFADRNAKSPALALGAVIGIGELDELWFDFWVNSTAVDSFRASRVQGQVSIDSRRAHWFSLGVSSNRVSSGFSEYGLGMTPAHDHLGLGPCDPAELPAWLARAANHLEIKWLPFEPTSNLRGKKRARLDAWLRGE